MAARFVIPVRCQRARVPGHEKRSGCIWAAEIDYLVSRATKGDPMHYLLKTEPTVYSFANLQRDKATIWDGVTNPTAVKHLREMKAGSNLLIYHTGDEKAAVGMAKVVSVDASDAIDASGEDSGGARR